MTAAVPDLPLPDPAFQLDAIPGVQGEQYAYTADQIRARDAQWEARLVAAVKAEREAWEALQPNLVLGPR